MKLLKLLPMVLLPLAITSCATDAQLTESDVVESTEAFEATTTADAEMDDPTIVGTWNLTALSYTGTRLIVTPTSVVTENISGTGVSFNNTATFTEAPQEAYGEGIYSVEETTSIAGQSETLLINGLNVVSSLRNWTLVDETLTLEAGGKVTTGTIVELTDTSLILNVIEEEVINLQGDIVETLEKDSTYEFVKM